MEEILPLKTQRVVPASRTPPLCFSQGLQFLGETQDQLKGFLGCRCHLRMTVKSLVSGRDGDGDGDDDDDDDDDDDGGGGGGGGEICQDMNFKRRL